jgi:hypothetical protein
MLPYPERPASTADDEARADISLRYEDISQDGRLTLLGMPHTIGRVVWRQMLQRHGLGTTREKSGAITVLTRLVLEGDDEPIAINKPIHVVGAWQLAHARAPSGEMDRLFLNMWSELRGPRARPVGPPPPGAGEEVRVGRLFAEHVFTRPFGPPGERKVVRLDAPGLPEVPEARWDWRPPATAMALPDGAQPLDLLAADPVPLAFGLDHCDSNQHVNSLVYPRMFTDAALRRFAALGRPTKVLARRADIGFRKPCFAGDRVRVTLQAFELDGRLGATGCFVPEADAAAAAGDVALAKAHCFVSMVFG